MLSYELLPAYLVCQVAWHSFSHFVWTWNADFNEYIIFFLSWLIGNWSWSYRADRPTHKETTRRLLSSGNWRHAREGGRYDHRHTQTYLLPPLQMPIRPQLNVVSTFWHLLEAICQRMVHIRPAENFCLVTLQTPLRFLGQNLFGDQFWSWSEAGKVFPQAIVGPGA